MISAILGASWKEGMLEKLLDPWSLVGVLGQLVFSARFIVQWLVSEREKRVVIPVAFWWLSITGGLVTLLYAVHRQDPVFMLAQAVGLVMYFRNLAIHQRTAGSAPA